MMKYLFISIVALALGSCAPNTIPFAHPIQELSKVTGTPYWFNVEGMICRDSSATGIGYRVGNPKKLAIYLNGGGACFNKETCRTNDAFYTASDWTTEINSFGNSGIFDYRNPKNPLKDFSFVYIPYCTGDVHSGNNINGVALDVPGTQRYVGAQNFNKAIGFIKPYFDYNEVEEVVLFGMSAGGWGVLLNYLEVNRQFPNARVTIINDSGPVMTDEDAFSPCLQLGFTLLYRIPLPNDLLNCCGNPALGLANVYEYSSKKYPNANFGFCTSYEDNNIRRFLSFGYDNCQGIPGNRLPADVFRSAVTNLREDVMKPKSNWSTYYIEGDTHVMLFSDELFYHRNNSGMYLYEWVDRLMKGEKMHISE